MFCAILVSCVSDDIWTALVLGVLVALLFSVTVSEELSLSHPSSKGNMAGGSPEQLHVMFMIPSPKSKFTFICI